VDRPILPEKRLVAAVLGRAVLDLFVGDRLQRASARDWLTNHKDNTPFSFVWCCEYLDLHVQNLTTSIVRESIKFMTEKEAEKKLAKLTGYIC